MGYSIKVDFRQAPESNNSFDCTNSTDIQYAKYFYKYILLLGDGSSHLLRLSGYPDTGDGYVIYDPTGKPSNACPGTTQPPPIAGPMTFYTTDGTYLTAQINNVTSAAHRPDRSTGPAPKRSAKNSLRNVR